MEVLEHIDQPEPFMAELVRMGRPGAQYLLSVPAPVGEHLQKGIAPASYYQSPNHVQIYTAERFAALVEDAGLVIEHRQANGFFWVMGMIFFWAGERAAGRDPAGAVRDRIQEPFMPLMESWARTWQDLLDQPEGLAIKQTLDRSCPEPGDHRPQAAGRGTDAMSEERFRISILEPPHAELFEKTHSGDPAPVAAPVAAVTPVAEKVDPFMLGLHDAQLSGCSTRRRESYIRLPVSADES